jgi:hypothetical protein
VPLDVFVVLRVAVEVSLEPLKLTDVGERVQVMVEGAPEQLTATVPVNPFSGVTVSLTVVDPVAESDREEAEAEAARKKSVPVPFSDTDCGLPLALSVTDKVPVSDPREVGVKVT